MTVKYAKKKLLGGGGGVAGNLTYIKKDCGIGYTIVLYLLITQLKYCHNTL